MIKQAFSDSDIKRCFPVLLELRPHLQQETFLSTILEMKEGGYQLVFVEIDHQITAVAGYRISQNLHMGKHLYVDDLVTAEQFRSKNYGQQLVEWLREQAKKNGCHYLHLDSGTHRHQAHKFYFRQGLNIASYHFSEKLN